MSGGNTGSKTIRTAYTYLSASSPALGYTTLLVQKIAQNGETLKYTYDKVGNITSVKVTHANGAVKTVIHEYDMLGQLTRCNDPYDTTAGSAGTTWVYAYDLGGNILSKKAYAYTTGSLSGAAVVQNSPIMSQVILRIQKRESENQMDHRLFEVNFVIYMGHLNIIVLWRI